MTSSRSLYICVMWLLLALIVVATTVSPQLSPHNPQETVTRLVRMSTKPGVSVSGLSSGAFFSVQLSIAFSRLVSNAAAVAGGAYNAAQGSVMTAITIMEHPEFISLPLIYGQLQAAELTNLVDSTSYLQYQYNYVFAGTKDTTVNPTNGLLLRAMYDHYLTPHKSVFDIPSEHAFITDKFGQNPCNFHGSPFINNCDFNLVYDIMSTFFPQITPPTRQISAQTINENLFQLDQFLFVPPEYGVFASTNGLNRRAYVYIPTSCRDTITSHPLFSIITYDKQREDDTNTGRNNSRLKFDQLREKMWADSEMYHYFNDTNAQGLLYNPNYWQQMLDQEQLTGAQNTVKNTCKVHIALHGCQQTIDLIGEDYIRNTGYIDYAEENNIITVFPQTTKTLLNPNSCWDWWGFSSAMYSSKWGVQGMTVMNLATTMGAMLNHQIP